MAKSLRFQGFKAISAERHLRAALGPGCLPSEGPWPRYRSLERCERHRAWKEALGVRRPASWQRKRIEKGSRHMQKSSEIIRNLRHLKTSTEWCVLALLLQGLGEVLTLQDGLPWSSCRANPSSFTHLNGQRP